ncbi:hypothetical protein TNCV_3642701 [Trichonephila clavipes]|nr:hypothetical protein TNCV_3642701 [Trichonephila clavipes]
MQALEGPVRSRGEKFQESRPYSKNPNYWQESRRQSRQEPEQELKSRRSSHHSPRRGDKFMTDEDMYVTKFKYRVVYGQVIDPSRNEGFPRSVAQMGDEAHFWLNGYVNKQNCRIWREANPQVYVETPLHPEKLTVWCALWAGGILLQKR